MDLLLGIFFNSATLAYSNQFSNFTRYKDVQDMQLAFVSKHWDELKSSPLFDEAIQEVTRGDLPHASDASAKPDFES